MSQGWVGGAIALVLGVALAIVAIPKPNDGQDALDAASLDEIATEEAREQIRVKGIAERPTWALGDAWRVQFVDEDGPVCWAVVLEADAAGYRHGFSCGDPDLELIVSTQVAGYGTRYIGNFSRDLASLAGDETVLFYDWPLEDGKSWTTTWFGQEAEVDVALAEDGDRFLLTMDDEDGDTIATYDYDPELRWWSEFRFDSGYVLLVHQRMTGWSEPATLGVAEDRFEFLRTAVQQLPVRPSFEVPETDDMLVAYVQRSGFFTHRFQFIEPDGSGSWGDTSTSNANILGSGSGSFLQNEFEAIPGVWSLDDQWISAGECYYLVRGVDLRTFAP